MTLRLLATLAAVSAAMFAVTAADSKDTAASKEALQEVGDVVGTWKANGTAAAHGRKTNWKETLDWGWKFKDGAASLQLEVKDGKYFSGGVLTYDPAKKTYLFAAKAKDGTEQAFAGKLLKGKLVLERKDAATGDVHKLSIGTLAEGARMNVRHEVQEKGRGPFSDLYAMDASKDGESFAGGAKKNICLITGGLGTTAVSYNGKTYYVCCSGCLDEFKADPKKYVEEFETKNKK